MIHLHLYFQPPSQTQHIQHTPTFSWYPSSVPSPYFLLPLNSIVVQVRNLEIILDIFFPFHPENLQSPDDSTFYLLLSSSMLPCILSQSTSPCNAFSHDYYKKPPLYMLSESLVLVPSNSSSRLLPMCGYWNAIWGYCSLPSSSCPSSLPWTIRSYICSSGSSFYPVLSPGQTSHTSPMLCSLSLKIFTQTLSFCHLLMYILQNSTHVLLLK